MRVIYVHGVSDGPTKDEFTENKVSPNKIWTDPNGYYPRLKKRFDTFKTIVTSELDDWVADDGYTDAAWGHLRPLIEDRTRGGKARFERFGDLPASLAESGSEKLHWEDYETNDGLMNAAAALDAIQLRTTSLSDKEKRAIHHTILELSGDTPNNETGTFVRVAMPTANETMEDIVRRLSDAAPKSTQSPYETFDENGRRSWMKTILDYLQKGTDSVSRMRARDWSSRELAKKWADAIWYIAPGRDVVLNKVLDDFAAQADKARKDEAIVILGHSLGGLIALEALNHKNFESRKLHEKCRWILLLFGAQVPIYHQLGVTPNLGMKGYFDGQRGAYRNIVDRNDPLGFFVGQPSATDVDVEVVSGINVLDSHSSYFDSPIVMREARQQIRAIKKAWDKAHSEKASRG